MEIEKEQDDPILRKAFAGVKITPAEDAFRDTLRGRVLAEARRVDAGRRGRFGWPRRWVAAASCAAGVLIATAVVWHFTASVPEAAAYNEMAKRIGGMNTVTYRLSWYKDGKLDSHSKHYMQRPNLSRLEMDGGKISVQDCSAGIHLVLNPNSHHATVSKMPFSGGGGDVLKGIADIVGSGGRYLRRERLEALDCMVYSVQGFDGACIVWIDVRTLLPARIEQSAASTTHNVLAVFDQFQWDAPIDASLFSLAVPQGYTLVKIEPTQSDMITMLRQTAELNGGLFPDKIEIMTVFDLIDKDYQRRTGEQASYRVSPGNHGFGISSGDDLRTQYGRAALTGLKFVQRAEDEGRWHYVGKGRKLGDAKAVIAWWKDYGTDACHAVYGDMSVRNVNPSTMPAEKAEESARK